MQNLDAVLSSIDANIDASKGRLADLLSIPSISTDPAYTKECERAADWLVAALEGLGYLAESRATPGHPIVVGHAKAKRANAPHVLFYGHYDVQPADPLELWETPPFEPRATISSASLPRRIRRQGPADDLRRGLPRL